jgi:penicillin amidase
MRRFVIWGLVVLFAAFCPLGCGEDKKQDPPVEPEVIEDLEISQELSLAGLSEPVDVVRDSRGVNHLYAANMPDLMRVEGYLMAVDRIGQMEFLRRGVTGRLAEVAGTLEPSLLDGDKFVRILGLHRQARALYESLEDDDPIKIGMDAYSEGVTAYIDLIRSGDAKLPGVLPSLLKSEMLEDWSAIDTLTLARYQTYSLSYDANAEVSMTEGAVGVAEAFPPDNPDGPSGEPGLAHDLWPFLPAETAVTLEGFYGKGKRKGARDSDQISSQFPSREQLEQAKRFFLAPKHLAGLMPDSDRGSNNWVVHGSKTASGYPILASDPHLSLPNPPLFWQVHQNTVRAGGDLDTMGLVFAGMNVVVLGFNRDLAWGATVSSYDVTDVYHETITAGADGEPDTVLFNGEQVPIEIIREEIHLNYGDPVVLDIEVVPHHGPIIPETRTADSALSFRWTGLEPSNEGRAFWGLATAKTVEEAFDAVKHFEVGGQNFVFAARNGDIGWNTHAYVPVRDPRALAYDPDTQTGICPAMVLPGTGEYEWTGRLADDDIPWDQNPERGWIATANQDGVGHTLDGNPFNDPEYLAWSVDLGHRMKRISDRLTELSERGGITPQEMSELQGDHKSPLGTKLIGVLVAALDRAESEFDDPGSQADLSEAVAEAGSDKMAKVFQMRDRLSAWTSFMTPGAVDDDPSAEDIQDSVAATLFNAIITRLTGLAFGDEAELIGARPGGQAVAKTLQWAMLTPESLVSYDSDIGDTWLWDDQRTSDVVETRDERILRATLAALEFLEGKLGSDMDGWRWGYLHTIRFKTQIPVDMIGPTFDEFSIPLPDDETYPDGFPRHGDNFVVDACNFSMWNGEDFSYDSGPTQRLVVEMTPDGPVAYNAMPGGQQHDGDAPHHADEAEYWRKNQAPKVFYEEIDVVQNAEERLRFIP